MSTRIARYCDRVVEACWLAVAILTPLFFNIYSARVFEPDKLTLLRSIALLMAAAWLIRTIEQKGSAARSSPQAGGEEGASRAGWRRALVAIPLLPQVVLLMAVYLLATVLSVAPRISFWGSYQRLQGTYTTLCYCLIFFITWQSLRTRAQLERLLNVIVLTSLPVALYGVLQHYGMDPLPWAGDVTERVTGNLGNAIFIAAYLIMAFFVTLERVVGRFDRLLHAQDSTPADAFAGGAYLFILALQALGIYFSKSRGPWLGLLAGVYAFVLISLVAMRRSAIDRKPLQVREAGKAVVLAVLSPFVAVIPAYVGLILARRGRRWLWLSWCIQSLLAVAFLIAFNLPNTPLERLREVPGLGRLGQVFDTSGGTGRVRVLIWEGAVEMLKANPARTLVGYGPEAMYVAYNPFYPPDLAHYESRTASPDRSHNETFDALVTTGVIGFLAYIALFIGIFWHGLHWLGLLPRPDEPGGRRQRTLFLALAIGGAALGALIPLLVDGSLRFAGVGMPAGLIAGVAIFLAIAAFRSPHQSAGPTSFGPRELLLVALLAMIVGHFVEIHFGIAIAATRVYFWLGLAVLLSAGSGSLSLEAQAEDAAPPQPEAVALSGRRRRRRRRQVVPVPAKRPGGSMGGPVAAGFIGALILGTIYYNYTTNPGTDRNVVQMLWMALSAIRPPNQPASPSPGIIAMVLLTWVLGAVLVVGESERVAPDRRTAGWWFSALGWYLGISLLVGLAYALFHASRLLAARDPGLLIYYYYAFVIGMILLAAAFLPRPLAGGRFWRGGWAWAAYPLLLIAIGVMILGNANVVRADTYFKQAWDGFHQPAFNGLNAHRLDRETALRYYDEALRRYERALLYAPQEDYYLLFFGKAYLERAEITPDAETKAQYLLQGEKILLQARDLNPLNTDHTANLARLYRTWAAVTKDDAVRQEKLAQSLYYYEAATQLSRHSAMLYNEWGRTLFDAGQPEQALATYQQSLALDDRYSQTYMLLSDYYTSQGDLEQARLYCERAVELEPDSATAHSTLGNIYHRLGMLPEAISENLRVLEIYPQDYVSIKNLAIMYGQSGRNTEALQAAKAARQLAPEADQAALDQFIAQLQEALGQESAP